jgi:PLP dependent protein
MDLTAKIERIRNRIAASGREITLLAVTKTIDPERVDAALHAGITVFGESKVQEAKHKIPLVSSRARWHFIGHLQTNKARDAVELFELIHSVDSLKLATELNRCADRAGKTQPILLEVNLAGEASKSGVAPGDVPALLTQINQLPRLEVRGLMTVPPYCEEPEKVRPYFRRLRELREATGLRELSMGMSHDFEIAIDEGATIIRVGTAIFGERKKHEPID